MLFMNGIDRSAISVMVPVYNSAAYIERTINCILSQTYTNFELIIVDDWSTDNTIEICNKYAKEDKRIKIFRSPEFGVGYARNCCLDKVTSKKCCFIDSDDYVMPDYLETLVKFSSGVDYLVTNATLIQSDSFKKELLPDSKRVSILIDIQNKKDFTEKFPLMDNGVLGTPWSKVYDIDLIRRYGIRYEIIQSEDELFNFTYLQYAKTLRLIDYDGYCYLRREGSESNSHRYITEKDWIDKMQKCYDNIIKKYNISDINYLHEIDNRFFERYVTFVLKGYFPDTLKSKDERLKIWKDFRLYLQTKGFYITLSMKESLIVFVSKFHMENIFDKILYLALKK